MEHLSDAKLVQLAQAGDQQAFGELCARYFSAIYDFAVRMTRDSAAAADIARESFQQAMGALGRLNKGSGFEAWIFAIARHTALSRGAAAAADDNSVAFDVVDSGRLADPADFGQAEPLAELVWRASTELERSQRTLLDLHLRQGLSSIDIAQVMGVRRTNAQVMIRRLRKAAEDSMRTFITINGERSCEALDAALAPAGGTLPAEVRKLVDEHVGKCDACRQRQASLLSPLAIFAAFRPVQPPDGLEEDVVNGLLQHWPGPAGMGGGDGDGQVWAFNSAENDGRHVRGIFVGLGLAAALLLILLLVPFSPIGLTRSDGETAVQAAGEETVSAVSSANAAPRSPTATPAAPIGVIAPPTPPRGPSPSPPVAVTSQPQAAAETPTPQPATPTAAFTATPTSIPTVTTPTNTPGSTPTTYPCTASLSPNTAIVNASQGATSFDVLNGPCKAAEFSVAVRGASWITIAPASGALQPFGRSTIGINANLASLGEGSHSGIVRVAWAPDLFFEVRVDVEKPGAPPVIGSVTAQCLADTGIVTVEAVVTDDFGVSSVVLDYMTAGGRAVAVMVLDGGVYRVRVAGPVLSFSVVAADFAEQSASRNGTC